MMSQLRIFSDSNASQCLWQSQNLLEIKQKLAEIGVRFEQWQAEHHVSSEDSPEDIMHAYSQEIERLKEEEGYVAVDVVSLFPDHPKKEEFRQKFLNEHIHTEDEVRFFVEGQGLFSLHIKDFVYELLCAKDDLIRVPANAKHWFDMGPNPHFVAIRLFNNPEGWVANFTGDNIASRYSRLEN